MAVQIGGKQSGDRNKIVAGYTLSGCKIICIIIRSIAYQSRQYEYQLRNLHINERRMNIN